MHIFFMMLLTGVSLKGAPLTDRVSQRSLPAGIDTSAVISQIRLEFNDINTRSVHFRKVRRELTDVSSEGGTMERFYDSAGKLKKIVCENYGVIGRTHEEYYVHNDSLFFAYRKEYLYKEPINVNMNPVIRKTTEDRYYFYQGGIIQWLEDKQKMGTAQFSKMTGEIQVAYKKYVRIP